MSAHHVLELASVYRELTADERRFVQEHTTHCAPCAHALAQAQRVDALLQTLPVLRSTPAQDAALRRRVYASRPVASRDAAGWRRRPQMAWLVIVIIIAGLLGSTGAVAGQSLPDTPLYPLKLASEQARGWLIWDATGQAEWQLARARARLDEINRLVAQGRVPSPGTLARLQQQLASALASTSRTPLSDTVRLLQQADALTGDALTQAEIWPLPTADDLAELRASLRQQQRVIAAGLAAPEQFRQTPTPAHRTEQPPTAAATPLDAAGPTCPPDCTPTPTVSPLPTTSSPPTATDAPPTATDAPPASSTATPTPSAAPTATPTATPAPSATPSPTPSVTPTRPRILPPRPSGTPRPRPTLPRPPQRTPTATPADTSTVNPAGTPTATPASTATPVGTVTPAPTATPTRGHTLPHITRTPRPPPRWTPPRWPPRPTATPVASPVRLAPETPTAPPSATPTPALPRRS